jgi:biotin operon repressor
VSGTLKQESYSLLRCGLKQARLTQEAQKRQEEYVRGARAAGASWQVIGAALGITRQSAWERFRHLSVDATDGATTSQRPRPPVRRSSTQQEAAERIERYVQGARTAGASWQVIGAALGITRQSAWERFRHLSVDTTHGATTSQWPLPSQLSSEEEIERVKYVRAARATGESWQIIGTRLGISRQWAWERFRHRLTPPRERHSYEPVPEAVLQARNLQPDEFAKWVIDVAKADRQIEQWLRKPDAQLGVYASRSGAIPPIKLLGSQILRTFLLAVSNVDGAPVQPRGSLRCPICGRSYLDDSFLERHKYSAHRNLAKIPSN